MNNSIEDFYFREKQTKFRGKVRVLLDNLGFEQTQPGLSLDPTNVKRILKIFELEGCNRQDPAHHVPAIISEDDLEQVLAQSDLSLDQLLHRQLDPPLLPLPIELRLRCLHGRHRIQAAQEFLLPGDQWWTVELYASDISERAQIHIREEFANSEKPSDGDIYRHVRYYQQRNAGSLVRKWLAFWSDSKRQEFWKIQKNSLLQQAFDNLLCFPGLWPALQIGMYCWMRSSKCHEETVCYLQHIYDVWLTVTCHVNELSSFVDRATVQLLQCRAPQCCQTDQEEVHRLMDSRQIFSGISDPDIRDRIILQLLSIPHSIPSIHTFLENAKILEAGAKVMRGLFPVNPRAPNVSLKQTVMKYYTGVGQTHGQAFIQNDEESFISLKENTLDGARLGYLQLWVFVFRFLFEMTERPLKKDPKKAKPAIKEPSQYRLYKFAELAYHLGFDSRNVQRLLQDNPNILIAFECTNRARPPPEFEQDTRLRREVTQEICKQLERIPRQQIKINSPSLSNDFEDIAISQRCGIPYARSYQLYQRSFFIRHVYTPIGHTKSLTKYITPFMVMRDTFLGFFGHDIPTDHLQEEEGSTVSAAIMDVQENRAPSVTISSPHSPQLPDIQSRTVAVPGMVRPLGVSDAATSGEKGVASTPRHRLQLTGNDFASLLKALEKRCVEEDTILFLRLRDGEYTVEPNNPERVFLRAQRIQTGQDTLSEGVPRCLGCVQRDLLKAVDAAKVYRFANQRNLEYKRVVVFTAKDDTVDGRVFSTSFQAYLLNMYGRNRGHKRKEA